MGEPILIDVETTLRTSFRVVESTVTFIAGKCMACGWNTKESRTLVSLFFTVWLTSICARENIGQPGVKLTGN